MFDATKPFGCPLGSNAGDNETVRVVTSVPPAERSASITLRIAVPFAARAALAVAARVSTPAEICARSGTASTTPVPVTLTVSRVGAGSWAPAPSGRSTPASAAITSSAPAASAMRFIFRPPGR